MNREQSVANVVRNPAAEKVDASVGSAARSASEVSGWRTPVFHGQLAVSIAAQAGSVCAIGV